MTTLSAIPTNDLRITDMQELICPEALAVKHPLTDIGIKKFLDDWKKVPGQK